jgi:hypothetical protein
MDRSFVYVVCGDAQVDGLNTSLRHLKYYSRSDILVLVARCASVVKHDQVVKCDVLDCQTDREAAIRMKVNVHRLIGTLRGQYCYLDTDIIATSDRVDTVFSMRHGPIMFAPDHVPLTVFSRHAVHCGCTRGRCSHLSAALEEKFGVVVADSDWQHWNGGVFLFDAESTDFLDTWSSFTDKVLGDAHWQRRDQGALIATVWHTKLARHPTLPREANYIVDRFREVPSHKRATAPPAEWSIDDSYSLRPGQKPNPFFIHFINGGVGRSGWKNWDDLERFQQESGAP